MLRGGRIVLAVAVLFLFLIAFLSLGKAGRSVGQILVSAQLVPATVRWLKSGSWQPIAVILGILGCTLLFGRIYCAILCPLGLLQDAIIFLRRRVGFRSFYYSKPAWAWRGVFLTGALLAMLLSSVWLISLLDPYSIFGRIATSLIKPVAIFAQNSASRFLSRLEIHWLWPKTYPPVASAMLWIAVFYSAVIILLSGCGGRLYCNLVCPVGTLLGLVSRFSICRVTISSDRCVRCGKCARICRAGCIEPSTCAVDASRCVACFDCLVICPVGAAVYKPAAKSVKERPVNFSRRFVLGAAGGAAVALLVDSVEAKRQVASKNLSELILPPGAWDVERFSAACIGCGLCVAQCPERIIRQNGLEYGWQGLMLPRLEFRVGHCAYECHRCGQVCPTGAIPRLTLNEKQTIQIGRVRLYRRRCIVHREHKDCGACIEACPTHAVYPVKRNNIHYPYTRLALCVGCGACQAICPMTPKAIMVFAVAPQGRAQKPPAVSPAEKATVSPPPTVQEFPF